MRFADLVAVSAKVAATRSRREKAELLADCLRKLSAAELAAGARYLAGELPQGRIGIGWATLERARAGAAEPAAAELEVGDVHRAIDELTGAAGPGSTTRRQEQLGALMSRATADERDFLSRLLIGELRQGALEGVLVDAVARAASVSVEAVRRALMLVGDLGEVVVAAMGRGEPGLSEFDMQLFRPVVPMLAQPAESVEEAIERLGEAAFELKLDGARVQLHKRGDEVRVYSRGLNEVTAAVPELVEQAAAYPARELVLDGEAIALGAGGTPLPFQTTMRRFGRRLEVEALRRDLPLSVFYFDCLYVDGGGLLDRPERERAEALGAVVPAAERMERLVTADAGAAGELYRSVRERGHEGLMAKSLDAPYAAGSRGRHWLKLKSAHTLNLVVLAAEWGSGRRRGFLSNLHLGARDPAGGFVMLGKTFKGLTDAMLQWQTVRLLQLERERDRHVVHVRPELVVEIAFSDVQESPIYPGGVALRFARVKSYREDKLASEADTIERVLRLRPSSQ